MLDCSSKDTKSKILVSILHIPEQVDSSNPVNGYLSKWQSSLAVINREEEGNRIVTNIKTCKSCIGLWNPNFDTQGSFTLSGGGHALLLRNVSRTSLQAADNVG